MKLLNALLAASTISVLSGLVGLEAGASPAEGLLPQHFIRGDVTGDGFIDIADPINTLGYLFLGSQPLTCLKAADVNDDGSVDIIDALRSLTHLFISGGEPPAPSGACGIDPTEDELTCDSYDAC